MSSGFDAIPDFAFYAETDNVCAFGSLDFTEITCFDEAERICAGAYGTIGKDEIDAKPHVEWGVGQSFEGMKNLRPYSGLNRFNDADRMCIGIHGIGKSSNDLREKATCP